MPHKLLFGERLLPSYPYPLLIWLLAFSARRGCASTLCSVICWGRAPGGREACPPRGLSLSARRVCACWVLVRWVAVVGAFARSFGAARPTRDAARVHISNQN